MKDFKLLRIVVEGIPPQTVLMEKRKKPRKVLRRKTLRKGKTEHVEDITNKVEGLKVQSQEDYIEETRSQPVSRRGSMLPPALLLNPSELTRRASNTPSTVRRGSQVQASQCLHHISFFIRIWL